MAWSQYKPFLANSRHKVNLCSFFLQSLMAILEQNNFFSNQPTKKYNLDSESEFLMSNRIESSKANALLGLYQFLIVLLV